MDERPPLGNCKSWYSCMHEDLSKMYILIEYHMCAPDLLCHGAANMEYLHRDLRMVDVNGTTLKGSLEFLLVIFSVSLMV